MNRVDHTAPKAAERPPDSQRLDADTATSWDHDHQFGNRIDAAKLQLSSRGETPRRTGSSEGASGLESARGQRTAVPDKASGRAPIWA